MLSLVIPVKEFKKYDVLYDFRLAIIRVIFMQFSRFYFPLTPFITRNRKENRCGKLNFF